MSCPQQNSNHKNNVNIQNVKLPYVSYIPHTINTMTTNDNQQMNEQAKTMKNITYVISIGQRSLMPINKYSRTFLFILNQEQ